MRRQLAFEFVLWNVKAVTPSSSSGALISSYPPTCGAWVFSFASPSSGCSPCRGSPGNSASWCGDIRSTAPNSICLYPSVGTSFLPAPPPEFISLHADPHPHWMSITAKYRKPASLLLPLLPEWLLCSLPFLCLWNCSGTPLGTFWGPGAHLHSARCFLLSNPAICAKPDEAGLYFGSHMPNLSFHVGHVLPFCGDLLLELHNLRLCVVAGLSSILKPAFVPGVLLFHFSHINFKLVESGFCSIAHLLLDGLGDASCKSTRSSRIGLPRIRCHQNGDTSSSSGQPDRDNGQKRKHCSHSPNIAPALSPLAKPKCQRVHIKLMVFSPPSW